MAEKPASRYSNLGELHDLLLRACPADRKGKRSIMILAGKLDVSYQNVYKWIEAGRIPPRRAKDIVKVSKGAVDLDEVLKFIL